MPVSLFARTLLTLLAGVAALVAGGYVAASIRLEAARLLALLVLVATCVLMATIPDSAPLWYQRAFLVLGPLSPIAGAAVSTAHKTRRVDDPAIAEVGAPLLNGSPREGLRTRWRARQRVVDDGEADRRPMLELYGERDPGNELAEGPIRWAGIPD